jgi:hypothetical protein
MPSSGMLDAGAHHLGVGGLFGTRRVVNPGDEVISLDPYFVMYRHQRRRGTSVRSTPILISESPDVVAPR